MTPHETQEYFSISHIDRCQAINISFRFRRLTVINKVMGTQDEQDCGIILTAEVLFCYFCARITFNEEGEETEKCLCTLNLFGITYGSLTTALSAGACDVAKSSVGLGFGITGVVLGTCGCLGLCLYSQKCPCACVESSEATNGSDEYPVLNQPI